MLYGTFNEHRLSLVTSYMALQSQGAPARCPQHLLWGSSEQEKMEEKEKVEEKEKMEEKENVQGQELLICSPVASC